MTTTYYRAPDGAEFRVTIESDDAAMSPRDADNPTIMVTYGDGGDSRCNMTSPDARYVADDQLPAIPDAFITRNDYGQRMGVDMRRVSRYVNLFGAELGILAIAGLDWRPDWSPTLRLRLLDSDADTRAEYDGYIVITRQSWESCMGDTPVAADQLTDLMRQDVDAYNRWASGEYVSCLVEQRLTWTRATSVDAAIVPDTMTTWAVTDSLGSIDDADYALTEALAMLPEGSIAIAESDLVTV